MSEHPHDALLQRYERRMTRALADALTAWQKAIVRGVPAADAQQIVQRVETTAQPLRDVIVDWLRQAAEAGVQQAVAEVERDIFGVKNTDALVAGFAWDQANEAAIAWAYQYGQVLVTQITETTTKRAQRFVGDWIQNGEPFNVLIERIQAAHDFSRSRAETIAVTEVTRAFARGNQETWRRSGVITWNRWNTANDEIVCPLCGPLHNKIEPIDGFFSGGLVGPPAHPRCRCWLTPVTSEAQARPVGLENQPSVGIAGDPAPPSIEQIQRELGRG